MPVALPVALPDPDLPERPAAAPLGSSDVDRYVWALRSATIESNPLSDHADLAPVASSLVTLMHATADFIDASRSTRTAGYVGALDVLGEILRHAPAPTINEEALAAFAAELDYRPEVAQGNE